MKASPLTVEASAGLEAFADICGFVSVEKVTCNITAVNSAGESPSIAIAGYTSLQRK